MLTDDVERYISLRQTLGFQLRKPARHLQIFARVATEKGETLIRAATVIEWAAAAPTLDARNRRIGDVARLARFLRAEDSRHEVPPTGLFATPNTRNSTLAEWWMTQRRPLDARRGDRDESR